MKLACLSAVFALALLSSTAAFATSLPAGITAVPLAAITNDRDTSVSNIELMLDGHAQVRGIYLETRDNKTSEPVLAKGRVYPLTGIESRDGVVLGQGQGVKAIFLRGEIEAQAGRGSLVIRYLTNGIFKHYSECRVNLERLGPDQWQLVNAYDGQPVEHIEVQTWALGISTLANVCPVNKA